MSDEDFAKLGDLERQETIQDWLDAMELDAEVENNPLYEAIFRLNKELGVTGCEWRFIDHPLMEGVSDPAKRAHLLDSVPDVGAEAWVDLPDGRRATGKVWVPNFNTPGYTPFSFLMELAEYAALRHAQRLRKRKLDQTIGQSSV